MHSSGESCSLGSDCQGAPRSAVTAACWVWECSWIPAPAKEDSGTSYTATASKASLLSLEGHSFPLWDFKVCCLPGWLTWVQCVHIRVLVAAADPALVSSGGCSWAEGGFQAGLPVSESRLCLAMAAGPGAMNLPFKACLLLCEAAMTTGPTSQDWYVRSEWVNED